MIPDPQCLYCRHLKDKCPAFDKIPSKIWFNEFNHHKPYPGDHGIQFEKK